MICGDMPKAPDSPTSLLRTHKLLFPKPHQTLRLNPNSAQHLPHLWGGGGGGGSNAWGNLVTLRSLEDFGFCGVGGFGVGFLTLGGGGGGGGVGVVWS